MSDALLVMAYGTPASLDDVETYYTDIKRGTPPDAEALEDLVRRYRAIGGSSPLADITAAQAKGIAERTGLNAYVGYKHAPPSIGDAVADMARDSVARAIGLVMAPHYSAMSVGDYERRARRAAKATGWDGTLEMVTSWHLEEGYVAWLAREVQSARGRLPGSGDADVVVFTAHSLPKRVVEKGDPYARQLEETAAAVAGHAGLERWRTAWQSAGNTGTEWLGPDLLEVLVDVSAHGAQNAVVCPCGFVADHLEVLYDIDREARALARELDLGLTRTSSPNDDPEFLDVLAAVAKRALASA